MKSKKAAKTPATGETMLRFRLKKDLAVAAWNMAAVDSLTFDAYVIKLILEDAELLRKLPGKERAKIIKFPRGRRRGRPGCLNKARRKKVNLKPS